MFRLPINILFTDLTFQFTPRKSPSILYDHINNKVLGKEQRLYISIDHLVTSPFILFPTPYPTKQPQYMLFS